MKRLVILLAIGLILCAFSTANATLLGIKGYAGAIPDVLWDSGGTIKYTASNDLFEVIAWDKDIHYLPEYPKPGSGYDGLINKVGFGIAITVDSSGNLTGGVSGHTYTWGSTSTTSDYDMIEYVLTGFDLVYKGDTYTFSPGDVFLAGEVVAFGWDDVNKNQFDFLIGSVSGKLVDIGLWPTNLPTGAYVDTAGNWGTWDWTQDLNIGTEKGDKYPVPEPATMLLLGSGLLGMGVYARRRFKK